MSNSSANGEHTRNPRHRLQVDGLSRTEGRTACLVIAAAMAVIAVLPGHSGPPTLIGWDKFDHLTAFAALTLTARSGWPGAPRWLTAAWGFGFGVVIEAIQSLDLVGRTASISDMAANAVGIGLGLAAAAGLAALAELRRRHS